MKSKTSVYEIAEKTIELYLETIIDEERKSYYAREFWYVVVISLVFLLALNLSLMYIP